MNDDAMFCAGCGAKTEDQVVVGNTRRDVAGVEHRENILAFSKVCDYFNKKRAEYEQYDAVNTQIERLGMRPGEGFLIFSLIMVGMSAMLLLVGVQGLKDGIEGVLGFSRFCLWLLYLPYRL